MGGVGGPTYQCGDVVFRDDGTYVEALRAFRTLISIVGLFEAREWLRREAPALQHELTDAVARWPPLTDWVEASKDLEIKYAAG